MFKLGVILIVLGTVAAGCARPTALPRGPLAIAPAPDTPDHPDTLAAARRLIVDSRTSILRAMVDRLAARAQSRAPVDSLALVRVMELWSEYAAQPATRPDSAAREWALAAVRVKERALGPDHHELAHSLGTLGGVAENARDPAAALVARERAVAILGVKRGRARAGLMTALDDLGRSAYWQSQPARAESLMRAAVDEGRAAGLTGEPRFQSALNNLAVVLEARGKLAEALEFQSGLLELRVRQFGPAHRRVQLTRVNLGALHLSLGRYEDALEHSRAALELDSLLAGQGQSRRETILQNLASTLDAMGDFASGRRLLEGSIAARSDTAGFVEVLLGDSYRRTGDFAHARRLYERGLRWQRANGGLKAHQATALAGLAALAEGEGHFVSAESLHREVLALRLEAQGPSHSSTGGALLALARCEVARGRLDDAEGWADSAARVLARARPGRHPDHAHSFETRALILERRGRTGDAAALLDSADAVNRDVYGPEHPRRSAVLGDLARLASARGERERALGAAARAAAIQRRGARIALASLTEQEALAYAAAEPRQLDALLAFTLAMGGDDPDAAWRGLDELIRTRALLLDAAVARRRGAAAGPEDSARAALKAARRRLARLWVAGLRDRSAAVHRALLDSARADVEGAERAIAGPAAGGPRIVPDPPGLAEILAALPPGSALVSYARLEPPGVFAERAPSRNPSRRSAPSASRYIAFALRAGTDRPVLVPLAAAAVVDSAVERWRRAAERGPVESTAAEAQYRRVAARLRRLVWDPIASHIHGAERLFVVPDEALQLVDLAALPNDDGRYLVESAPPIALLTAEDDLLVTARAEAAGALLAIGDPAFDAAPGAGSVAGSAASQRGLDACEEFLSRSFARLPASTLEVDEVAAAWREIRPDRPALVLRGDEATESRLRAAAPGAAELHIATHGFFLPERCGVAAGLAPPTGSGTLAGGAAGTALLRAGLALAGANRRVDRLEEEDDGVLTAEEIAMLDLDGVRSVVLSACEVAQGDALPGEGVFGVRRALHLAGARAQVMSLWRLEDARARAWMSHYYRARWRERRDVAGATQAASRELLSLLRRRGRPTHPAAWGGFIAVGRD